MTTDSNHDRPVYPNLAAELEPRGLNQLWVADIKYICLETEYVYLAVVLDAYSRRVIGWELDRRFQDDLAIAARAIALRQRSPAVGLVHHSDRGVQYASKDYTDLLKQHGAKISMSRKGNQISDCAFEPHHVGSGGEEDSRRLIAIRPGARALLARGPVLGTPRL